MGYIKIIFAFLAILGCRNSAASTKIHHFSIEQSSSSIELSIEPIVEEFKQVVSENNDIENRHLQICKRILIFSARQDTDAEKI